MLRAVLATAILLPLIAIDAAAGTVWRDLSDRGGVELDAAFPGFEFDGVSASIVSLTGRRRLSEDLVLHADVPYLTASDDDVDVEILGNPYVGLELGKAEMDWTVESGLRLPLIPSDPDREELGALATGVLTDFLVRPGAFVVDAIPVELTFHYRPRSDVGSHVAVHLGLEVWAPIDERDDTETAFVFGGDISLIGDPLRVNLGATGRIQFDESGDEGEIEFEAGIEGKAGRVRPGLQLRIPVDDLADLVDYVIVAYVGVH